MNTRRWSTFALSAMACAMVASAQTSQTTGALRGTVKSKKGGAVAGATVSLRNLETGAARTIQTTAQGEYQFSLLPVGAYEITVSASGLRTAKNSDVRVFLGQSTAQNFNLDAAEVAATVEVVAESTVVDTKQVNNVTSIDEQLVKSIPLNGRNFTDLALLTPGVSDARDSRVTAEGARGIMNNLSIDGASFNSKFFGEQRGSTRIPFAFGADTIRELQVITNAYDAQYGQAAGAIINAVSKTGTNEFGGTALLQFRPESLVARIRPVPYDPNGSTNRPEALQKKFSQFQGNINVGGPIIKDKLHYFVGVETYHYTEDYTPALSVNSAAGSGNTQADLNNFLQVLGNSLVIAPGGRTYVQDFNRTYTNDRKNTVAFARLDWTINENHSATLRVNSQNWRSVNGTTTGTGALNVGESNNGIEENRSLSWVAELRSIFGSNWVNEARVQIATERRPRLPQSYVSSEISVNGKVAGQNEFLPNGLDEKTLQVVDNLTWTSGDWTVKGGIDLQGYEFLNQFFRRQNGQWSFTTYNAAWQWARPGGDLNLSSSNPGFITYQQGLSPTNGYINYKSRFDAAYLQGQYAGLLDRRLLLNFGFRYTRESFDDNPNPNPALQGLDRAADNSSVDPRFAFTYDLKGDGKTLIKGGYGQFTNPDPDLIVSNTMLGNGNGVKNYSIQLGSSNRTMFQSGGILSYGARVQGGSLQRLSAADIASDSRFVAGTLTGQVWDPDNKMPQSRRASIGVEQDASSVLQGLKVGARVSWAKLMNLQYFVNINLRQLVVNSDGTTTADPNGYYNDGYPTKVNRFTTSGRPGFAYVRGRRLDLSQFGNVYLTRNDGEGEYKALILEASRRSEDGFGFSASLTFSKAEDNNSNERTTSGSDSATSNPADPLALIAPTDNDRRFRGVFAAYFPVAWGIRASAYFTYATGRPYSANDSADINGDGLTGNDLSPFYPQGRNVSRQPHTKTFDIRLTRPFYFGKRFGVEATLDIFNVLNWANQVTTLTNVSSTSLTANPRTSTPFSTYGAINTPDRNTREVQVGVRIKF